MVGNSTNPRRMRLPLEALFSLLLGYFLGLVLAQILLGNEVLPSTREELIGAAAAFLGVPLTFLILRGLLLGGQEEQVLFLRANALVRLALFLSTFFVSLAVSLFSNPGLKELLYQTGLGEQLGFLADSDLLRTVVLVAIYLSVLRVLSRLAIAADGYRHLGEIVTIPPGEALREQIDRALRRRVAAHGFLYAGLSLVMEGFFVVTRYSVFSQELHLQQGLAQSQGFWLWRLLLDGETVLPSLLFLGYVFFLKRAPLAALHREAVEAAAAELRGEGIPISYPQAPRGPSPMEAIGIFGVLATAISVLVSALLYAGVYLFLTTGVAGLLAGGWR